MTLEAEEQNYIHLVEAKMLTPVEDIKLSPEQAAAVESYVKARLPRNPGKDLIASLKGLFKP
jgi:mono/diheme cytochrome c family protein